MPYYSILISNKTLLGKCLKKMIEIELRLFATLAQYIPATPERFKIAHGTRIEELLLKLGIPKEEAKLIFINGKKQDYDHELQNGDRVGIFPPVGGG